MEQQQDVAFVQRNYVKQAKTGLFNFVGGGYQSWSPDFSADLLMNLFCEIGETGTAKNKMAMYGTPGITLFATCGDGPIRGMLAGENRLFVVSGAALYEVFQDGTVNNRGAIADDGNPVYMAFSGNGGQLVIAAGMGSVTVNYTDLTTTMLGGPHAVTSAANPFSALQGAGQTLVITGGGSFIPGAYVIQFIDGYGTAYLNKPVTALPYNATTGGVGTLSLKTGQLYCDSGLGPVAQRFSVQYTDLVIDSIVNTEVSSASQPFNFQTDSGYQLTITGGAGFTPGVYTIVSVSANGVAQLSAPAGAPGSIGGAGVEYLSYVPAVQVAYLDTFFIAQAGYNSRLFYISGSDDGTNWDAGQVVAKSSYPDNINAIFSDHEQFWLFGSEESTEAWQNVGGALIPFARNNSMVMHYGIESPFSVARLQQGFCWLAVDQRRGGRFLLYAQGAIPSRVSNHAVEAAWNSYGRVDDAVAWSYEEDGHEFYVLDFPTANATWVYDPLLGPAEGWHQRGWWNGVSNDRQRQSFHAYVNLGTGGAHYVGDWSNGKIYVQSINTFTDNGTAVHRIRVAPHISTEQVLNFYHRFQLDMETGNGAITPLLDWSDDGGHTFGNYNQPPSLGSPPAGPNQYGYRVIWTPLGSSRDRVFQVVITDPVKVAISNAYLDCTAGTV